MHNGEQTHRVCLFYQRVNVSMYRDARRGDIKPQPRLMLFKESDRRGCNNHLLPTPRLPHDLALSSPTILKLRDLRSFIPAGDFPSSSERNSRIFHFCAFRCSEINASRSRSQSLLSCYNTERRAQGRTDATASPCLLAPLSVRLKEKLQLAPPAPPPCHLATCSQGKTLSGKIWTIASL